MNIYFIQFYYFIFYYFLIKILTPLLLVEVLTPLPPTPAPHKTKRKKTLIKPLIINKKLSTSLFCLYLLLLEAFCTINYFSFIPFSLFFAFGFLVYFFSSSFVLVWSASWGSLYSLEILNFGCFLKIQRDGEGLYGIEYQRFFTCSQGWTCWKLKRLWFVFLWNQNWQIFGFVVICEHKNLTFSCFLGSFMSLVKRVAFEFSANKVYNLICWVL